MKRIEKLIWILTFSVFFLSCEKDQNQPMDNEEELITDVVLSFTDELGMEQSFTFSDPDGPGGNDPVQEEIRLSSLQSYELAVQFLDSSDPMEIENITLEVLDESDEHLVCYGFDGSISTLTIVDVDQNNMPLGLEALLTTNQPGSGTLTVSLKHLPDKTNALPCNTGETDVEVTFAVVVQ